MSLTLLRNIDKKEKDKKKKKNIYIKKQNKNRMSVGEIECFHQKAHTSPGIWCGEKKRNVKVSNKIIRGCRKPMDLGI